MIAGQENQRLSEIAVKPAFRRVDGLSIRFAESGRRGADALLLSPWPESVFAYEPTWLQLAESTHVVAIDLPGFGRSERKDKLMSPRAMGDFIVRAADAFGLEHPHIVGPDVGTAAALFAAAAQPGRFLSLVVGTGGTAVPIQLGDPLREWVFAADLEPYRRMNVGSLLLGIAERESAARGVRLMVLETATANKAAIAFWLKHGYRRFAKAKNYYGPGLDAFRMHKTIRTSKGTGSRLAGKQVLGSPQNEET